MFRHHSPAPWRGGYREDNIQLIMFLLAHSAQNEEQRVYLIDGWYWYKKIHLFFSIKLIWHQSPSAKSDNTALETAFHICCQQVVAQSLLVVSCRKLLEQMSVGLCKKLCKNKNTCLHITLSQLNEISERSPVAIISWHCFISIEGWWVVGLNCTENVRRATRKRSSMISLSVRISNSLDPD